MTTPMKSWQFSAWHSWHVMIVTRDLWRGSSDLRRDQCNGPRRPLTIPCHCLMGPATNFHQTCNTALYCICTAPPSSQFPLIIIMSRLTLPVAGSSCSLECSTWISLTPASREQNWNDYIKTSTFPINQPTVLTSTHLHLMDLLLQLGWDALLVLAVDHGVQVPPPDQCKIFFRLRRKILFLLKRNIFLEKGNIL